MFTEADWRDRSMSEREVEAALALGICGGTAVARRSVAVRISWWEAATHPYQRSTWAAPSLARAQNGGREQFTSPTT